MKEEGYFMPIEIAELETLKHIEEKWLLSIYWFYTVKANQHKCTISNTKLMKILCCCEKSFKEYKKHLVSLGYIESNKTVKGSVVRYIGIGEQQESDGVKITPTDRVNSTKCRCKNYHNDRVKITPTDRVNSTKCRCKNYPNDRVKITPTDRVNSTPQNNISKDKLIIYSSNSGGEHKPIYSEEELELYNLVKECDI